MGYEWDNVGRRLIWNPPPWWLRWWWRLRHGNGMR